MSQRNFSVQWDSTLHKEDACHTVSSDESETMMQTIRESVIGEGAPFEGVSITPRIQSLTEHERLGGPFCTRKIVYADYTASGRALSENL